MTIRRALRKLAFATSLAVPVVACDSSTDPSNQLLRVRNVGTLPIGSLRVVFPGTSAEFGDLAAGAITGYQRTAGVYRYAPFRYTFDGTVRYQLVDDFVGEVPETGRRFTYNVALVRGANDSLWLGLRSVTRDN